jgi:hypothetical protein
LRSVFKNVFFFIRGNDDERGVQGNSTGDNDLVNFHSSFERRIDTINMKSGEKVLNSSMSSLFGIKKCACCKLYEDPDEFLKKYVKGMVKSKNISTLKSSVNFADYLYNQDVSHLMDKKKQQTSEMRKSEKFMTTISTFYTKRNKLTEGRADDSEDDLSKTKGHHRGKSEDIVSKISTLELKREIPNFMTGAPSGRQEAFRLKNWVLEKEGSLMESLKGSLEKGNIRRTVCTYKFFSI